MKTKIFAQLKLQASSLGFNSEELEGVAAHIADNLNTENATDDEINIAIASTISYLKVAQKAANRVIETARKKSIVSNVTEGSEVEPTQTGTQQTPQNNDDEPTWFKNYRETQEKRITAIENEKIGSTRRSQLEEVVRDSGTFGVKTLKDFSRMDFKSDETFNEYLEETKIDAASFKQEDANRGLSGMGKPSGSGATKEGAEAIANLIDQGTKQINEQSKK